ncbi:unnamed protein product [Mytilus edulis]|uniref:CCHC-type domain-containing protein n=1 Tax=Mytilus edulis TaxID=6550 RepID=A0A8S3SF84_MYTED|nr:unnamed protein product [Mytilus edulis]
MKCRCIDKECHTIADAVDVIERYESILGDQDKKKSTMIRAVESKDTEGHMSEKDYHSNLQALQDRIAKLEQGHGSRETKRANTGRCYGCNSPDHFMRNCPHKNNQRARGNFQGNQRQNTSFNHNQETTERWLNRSIRINRSQTGNQSSATPSGYCIDGWDPDSIRQCQLEDPDMSLIVTYLQEKKNKPDWDQVSKGTSFQKTIWRQWDRLTINNGMLYRKFYCSDKDDVDNFKLQLLVPKSHQKTVFKYFHDVPSAGHLGPDKMLSRIQQLLLSSYEKLNNKVLQRM